jgi:hypothetical protein
MASYRETGRRVFAVSAKSGLGLDDVRQALLETVARLGGKPEPEEPSES